MVLMKFNYSLAIALALCSCTQEIRPDTDGGTMMPSCRTTVNASFASPATKTALNYTGKDVPVEFNWQAGDRIGVFEIIPGSDSFIANQVSSSALETNASEAIFTVDFSDQDNPDKGDMQYVAFYPADANVWADYGVPMDIGYGNLFPNSVDYTDMPDHALVNIDMPGYQKVREGSFDPNADIMVSTVEKRTFAEGRPASLNLRFARVGTVACFVLHGLEPGTQLNYGGVSFPDTEEKEYRCAGYMVYDTYLQMVSRNNDGISNIYFEADTDCPPTADADGNMTIFLRMISGAASSMLLEVETTSGNFSKEIDFQGLLGSPMLFNENGMTVLDINITGTSIDNPAVDYTNNSSLDGFTAWWPVVTDAAGYECFYTSADGARVNLTAVLDGNVMKVTSSSGLAAGQYTLNVRSIAKEGLSSPTYFEKYELNIGIPSTLLISQYTDGIESINSIPDNSTGNFTVDGIVFSCSNVQLASGSYSSKRLYAYLGGAFIANTTKLRDISRICIENTTSSYSAPVVQAIPVSGDPVTVTGVARGSVEYIYDFTSLGAKYDSFRILKPDASELSIHQIFVDFIK